ncbi:hypothetical protein [Alcaligenes faecalis]|uniref:hypothetical protein n=1 Tax=Alcaligenes faecalis TaxID=511 RepID=UPI001C9A9A22|nr:hypothetical protein [Alcaligenes faecalis]MBY6308491.1 hypothetical protein [Alcaligenes faecalis]MBY6316302.1 hypothetical protein [Alcaligenes faecalis]MBY6390491.1 hypothetical protein [Alcaligenes faecalis]
MEFNDPKIQSALIAAAVTIATLLLRAITKSIWERNFYKFKLESDYKYDQRKKVREAISKYKVSLLNSAESLNHRLWNFSKNAPEAWHTLREGESISEKYYLLSFCYRFLTFFSLCQKIDLELIYLDSTVSTQKDLDFLKYLKLFPQIFCDTEIFKGTSYNQSLATDHFFSDDFREIVSKISNGEKLLSYSEFKEKVEEKEFTHLITYFSGVLADQSCLRWQALNSFHFILMAFLNDYGYDFQKTSRQKMLDLAEIVPKNSLVKNSNAFIKRACLNKNQEVLNAMSALSNV